MSTLTKEDTKLVHGKVKYQVEAKFSEVVFLADILVNVPPSLKLSSMAVMPQEGRRGCTISNYRC